MNKDFLGYIQDIFLIFCVSAVFLPPFLLFHFRREKIASHDGKIYPLPYSIHYIWKISFYLPPYGDTGTFFYRNHKQIFHFLTEKKFSIYNCMNWKIFVRLGEGGNSISSGTNILPEAFVHTRLLVPSLLDYEVIILKIMQFLNIILI